MTRKTPLIALTGLFIVAMTLSITPASAHGRDNDCERPDPSTLGKDKDRCCYEQDEALHGNEHGKKCRPPCEDQEDPRTLGRDKPCRPPCEDDEYTGTIGPARHHKPDPCEEDPCIAFDLYAEALDGGAILLTYNLPDDARGVRVLRDGDFIGGVAQPGEQYLDETAVIGETYVYTVEVWYPDSREPAFYCEVEVTSVPVFGSVVATGLAVGLGLLAYAGVRRRV